MQSPLQLSLNCILLNTAVAQCPFAQIIGLLQRTGGWPIAHLHSAKKIAALEVLSTKFTLRLSSLELWNVDDEDGIEGPPLIQPISINSFLQENVLCNAIEYMASKLGQRDAFRKRNVVILELVRVANSYLLIMLCL